jgi:hypothetical protein
MVRQKKKFSSFGADPQVIRSFTGSKAQSEIWS